MSRTAIIAMLLVGVAFVALGWIFRDRLTQQAFAPTERETKIGTLPVAEESALEDIEVIAQDLTIPWEIAFLPDSSLLVTERPGRLVKIDTAKHVIPISGVEHRGEGGLLGLALHPNFSANQYVYLYLTTRSGGGLTNRVERYQLQGIELTNRTVIIENIPGAQFHDGGRIAFGPDSKLYITTGDAGNEPSAQDENSLAGKILRLNDDGTIPSDNPFNTAVYSYGHRNPQGLAWDNAGRLWATEHGRSGARSGFDEVNHITPGTNYGWPNIQGDETQPGLALPAAHSGPTETWAPAGAAYLNGSLLFTGLRGQALYEAKLSGTSVTEITAHLPDQFGRLRTVVVGPDNMLYIATSNQDGRGDVQPGDDKIIRINPELIFSN